MKNKSFFFSAFASVLLLSILLTGCKKDDDPCPCSQGYTGDKCETQLTPSKIVITRIDVLTFPPTNSIGGLWDALSGGPDIFPLLRDSYGNELWRDSRVYSSANANDCPYVFNLNPAPVLDDPTSRYSLVLYDDDGPLLGAEQMGGVEFTPYSSSNKFPAEVVIAPVNGATSYKIYLSYSW